MEKVDDSWVNVVTTYQHCPHCKLGLLDTRVKRGFFVRNFFGWMNLRRYQCSSCGKKTYLKKR